MSTEHSVIIEDNVATEPVYQRLILSLWSLLSAFTSLYLQDIPYLASLLHPLISLCSHCVVSLHSLADDPYMKYIAVY